MTDSIDTPRKPIAMTGQLPTLAEMLKPDFDVSELQRDGVAFDDGSFVCFGDMTAADFRALETSDFSDGAELGQVRHFIEEERERTDTQRAMDAMLKLSKVERALVLRALSIADKTDEKK